MNATEKRTGQAVELGRYVTDLREERILIGRRIDGVVCVFDAPLRGRGRTFTSSPASRRRWSSRFSAATTSSRPSGWASAR